MLILRRKKNEQIVINGNITVMVVDIRGDTVHLGIQADKSIQIHRKEIWDRIQNAEPVSADTTHGGGI